MESPAVKEAADISGDPVETQRGPTARHEEADGQSLQAGPDAKGMAPGKERPALQGQPLKYREKRDAEERPLGRASHQPDRASDAEGRARLAAKDRHPRIRALVRRYGYRVQEG